MIFFVVEEVSINILQDQVSLEKNSNAGVFKYIVMEIPFYASVTEYV